MGPREFTPLLATQLKSEAAAKWAGPSKGDIMTAERRRIVCQGDSSCASQSGKRPHKHRSSDLAAVGVDAIPALCSLAKLVFVPYNAWEFGGHMLFGSMVLEHQRLTSENHAIPSDN